MNRQIKFKAKRIDDGKWVYGDLTHVQKICSPEEENLTGKIYKPVVRVAGYDIDENTIGQFTGITDKAGKDIYEGDLLEYSNSIRDVFYEEERARFVMRGFNIPRELNNIISQYCKVIGSVHDGPNY